jgi:Autoinducer binding domain
MVMDALEFQEEASSLHSISELQGATAQAMAGIDLPYFSYAWSRSSSPSHLDMADDSFFINYSGEFFSTYIEGDMYKSDYTICACRGTTTIPSLIGRTYHRWRDVPPNELSASERAVDDLGREYFVDGLTGRIESHDGLFFSGASVVGQGMSMREFNHALTNAGTAFQFLRIYHDRFHQLRQAQPTISVAPADLKNLLVAMRRGDIGEMEGRVAELIRRGENISAPPLEHSSGYDRITLHGRQLKFGSIQARIIALLYAASQTGNPWVLERDLMGQAKSSSRNLHDVFRRHDRGFLFEADAFGRVRLRL